MKKHVFRIGLVVTMLLGLMMISANAADCPHEVDAGHGTGWTEWTQALIDADVKDGSVAAGNYYLSGNVTFTGTLKTTGKVNLCLNGYTMTFNLAKGTAFGGSGAWNICDCCTRTGTAGTITAPNSAASSSKYMHLFSVTGGGDFYLWNGNITKFYGNYGIVQLNGNGASFNMYGGNITEVGAVYDGVVSLFRTAGGTTFVMEGGTIDVTDSKPIVRTRNTSGTATVTVSGDSTLKTNGSQVFQYSTGTFDVAITGGTFSQNVSDYITDKETYGCFPNDDGITWSVKKNADVNTSDLGEVIHGVGNGYWLPYTSGSTEIENGKNYYLKAAATDVAQIVIPENTTVGFCLHGYDLTSAATDNAFVVESGATLNLCPDCTKDGTITGADGSRAIQINGGTVNMSGGTITGFTTTGNGGAVYVDGGIFTMTGGTITGNEAKEGGAIYATGKSTVNVEDGTISNNTANTTSTTSGGGAIWCNGGNVNLSGGEITGNHADGAGGAARINGSCVLTVSGDVKIHANTSAQAAAVVLAYYGSTTVNIKGGYIYNNIACQKAGATGYGAAIRLYGGTTKLTVSDGAVIGLAPSGNPAANYCAREDGTPVAAKASIACVYGSAGASTITGGKFYANEGDPLFDTLTTDAGATDTGAIKVSGGSFSASLADKNLADGYHDYRLSKPADKNLPYQVEKTFSASSVQLGLVSGGLRMRVNYKLPVGSTADFTVECNEGVNVMAFFSTYVDLGVAAKDMGDQITLTLKNNGKAAGVKTFSVKEYAVALLEKESSSTELKSALSDLLCYGAAAQTYFETGDTAVTDGVTLEGGSEWNPKDNCNLGEDETELYKGSSLSLKNKINMNLYFDSSVTAVKVNGTAITPKEDASSGYKVASVTDGLNLANATEQIAIEITVGENEPITVYDSIEAYAYRTTKLATENKNLTDLCQKMMNFVTSAQAYFDTL